jgi:effector-binding domain-containing protein
MVERLPIGLFARLAGLTVRAVRHYGELGLLQPVHVDPETGYRFYSQDQLVDAAVIRRLRFLELALDEIREIITANDPSFTRARLVEHRAKMAELAATTGQILNSLQRLIEGEEELVPGTADIRGEIEIKEVPAQNVLAIRERAPQEKLPEIIPAAIDEIHDYLKALGVAFAGAPYILCPYADDAGIVDLEVGWPVAEKLAGRGRFVCAILPAATMLVYLHRGDYRELDGSYRALQGLLEQEELTVTGAPREIYLTSPDEVPVEEWLTEIQFPIVRDEARIAAVAG